MRKKHAEKNGATASASASAFVFAVLLILIGGNACKTVMMNPNAAGRNYLAKNFKCRLQPLMHALKPAYIKRWALYRSQYAAENKRIQTAVAVITGESTAMLFTPERISRYLPGAGVVNRGIGGESVRLLRQRIQEDALSLKPQVVIIAIGGNDLLGGRCLKNILGETDELLRFVRRVAPKTAIFMVSVPPVGTWKMNAVVPFYNMHLKKLIQKHKGVRYMDLWPSLSRRDRPGLAAIYVLRNRRGKKDQVHFNEAAYKRWAQLIKKSIPAK